MTHREALTISTDLDNISDRNMVHFFREELRAHPIGFIPGGPRKRLKEVGIIKATWTRGARGSGYALTPHGEALLREAELDQEPSGDAWVRIDLKNLFRLCFAPP